MREILKIGRGKRSSTRHQRRSQRFNADTFKIIHHIISTRLPSPIVKSCPFEALPLRSDLTIVSGLNEGTWPRTLEMDPWLSLTHAHRFRTAPTKNNRPCGPRFLPSLLWKRSYPHARRRNQGTPTVPSRWLSRLEIAFDLHKRNHPAAGGPKISTHL